MTLKAMEGIFKQGILRSDGDWKKIIFFFFPHLKNISAETIYPDLDLRGKI